MGTALKGQKEIKRHLKMGWDKIIPLIRSTNLPVAKIGNVWWSDAQPLDQWHRDRLNGLLKAKK